MTSTEYQINEFQPEECHDEDDGCCRPIYYLENPNRPDGSWRPIVFPRKAHKIFFSPEDEYNQVSDVLENYCQQKGLTYTPHYLDSFYEWLLTADMCHTHYIHNTFDTGIFMVPRSLLKLVINWAKCFSLDIQRDLRLLKFKKCLDYTCRKKQFTCDKDELFHNFIKWYDESPIYKNTYDEYPPHIPVAEYIYMIKNTKKTT
jgi:hypothetical protein